MGSIQLQIAHQCSNFPPRYRGPVRFHRVTRPCLEGCGFRPLCRERYQASPITPLLRLAVVGRADACSLRTTVFRFDNRQDFGSMVLWQFSFSGHPVRDKAGISFPPMESSPRSMRFPGALDLDGLGQAHRPSVEPARQLLARAVDVECGGDFAQRLIPERPAIDKRLLVHNSLRSRRRGGERPAHRSAQRCGLVVRALGTSCDFKRPAFRVLFRLAQCLKRPRQVSIALAAGTSPHPAGAPLWRAWRVGDFSKVEIKPHCVRLSSRALFVGVQNVEIQVVRSAFPNRIRIKLSDPP